MRSTSATLETAASPAEETIMMSAMPTMTARNCSIIKGRMSLRRACLLNTGQSSFSLWLCSSIADPTRAGQEAKHTESLAIFDGWGYNLAQEMR